MDKAAELFTKNWKREHPEVELPSLICFKSLDEILEALQVCNSQIKNLQQTLKAQQTYKNYLESLNCNDKSLFSASEDTTKKEEDVEVKEESNVGISRRSTVLENVKLFESKVDTKDGPGDSNSLQRVPTRRRTAYLEMWECKSGPDMATNKNGPDDNGKMFGPKRALSLTDKETKVVPKSRVLRSDYVEVWQCSSGNQQNIEIYDSDVHYEDEHHEDEHHEMYDVTDIDMRDGFGKRHYTIASSDVKLLTESTADGNMTWPSKPLAFQEEDEMSQSADQFEQIDLSDEYEDDESTCSHESGNENEKAEKTSSTSYQDIGKAQTTNERVDAAMSTMWLPGNQPRCQFNQPPSFPSSVDIQSSDDDQLDGEEHTRHKSHHPIDKEQKTSCEPQTSISNSSNYLKPSEVVVTEVDKPNPLPTSYKHDASQMVDYQKIRNVEEAEKLRMRRWVLTSILKTEQNYLQYLNTLLLYMKPLHATISTSQPVMSSQDYETAFYRVKELHNLHSDFYSALKPRIDSWTCETEVGDIFGKMMSKLNLYKDYLHNYKKAKQTVEKCSRENEQFASIISELKVQTNSNTASQSISLIEVLYKPVDRLMKTPLYIQDLLKQTSHRHPDYQTLRKLLKNSQAFLEKISTPFKTKRAPSSVAAAARNADRYLIKEGFLVEVSGDGQRKLRHCFLYTDLLLCAKHKSAAGMFHSKASYDCKWFIPLADLSFTPFKDSDPLPEYRLIPEEDIRDLTLQAQQMKIDIAKERKHHKKLRGRRSNHATPPSDDSPVSRREERFRNKLKEFNSRIVINAPSLPLKIYHNCGKSYLFLMSSDYERIEWQESIAKQQESCFKSFSLTSLEITNLLNESANLNKMPLSNLMIGKEDDSLLSGYLTVTIHCAKGFLSKCNPYCCLEVDSFGQFQTKAITRHCDETETPSWEEEFELEVDGAQQLRILIFEKSKCSEDQAVLIAKTKVELRKQVTLDKNGRWNKTVFHLGDIDIQCSFHFVPREHSLQRLPSKATNGVFGVKLDQVAKRDISGIPSIVKKLVEEIERRGMNELGLYRVSGVVSGIQALKSAFDTNRKDVGKVMSEVDVNAVAGVLKLYFRELPEPLFTNARYNEFVNATTLMEPETKLSTFRQLVADLPATNYKTFHFLRNHLLKVAQNEAVTKMNLQNIATVFGPTLLRPAGSDTTDLAELSNLRLDVHFQMDALLYCLEHVDMLPYEQLRASKTKEAFASVASTPCVTSSPPQNVESPLVNRFRPYEEIVICNEKPTIVSNPRPTPAPRKPAKNALTTDL